jgi:hypothetical protein
MAYQVDKFNGTFLTSVADGTIDTTTDLRFVGKNYAGYGEVQNENFLHLLENFANTTEPPKRIAGQIWYDSGNKKLKFFDGTKFKIANGAESSSVAPSGLATGEFWWDETAKQLYAWSGTDFILVGPEAAPDLGASSVVAQVVKDNVTPVPNNHSIVKVISSGKTIAIISQDEFTLNETINPIQDFTTVKKGITLVKTNVLGVSSDDHFYWGTASDSNRLAGLPAATYLRRDDLTFEGQTRFLDPGFILGGASRLDPADLRVRVENENEVIIEQLLGNPITVRINRSEGTDERDVAQFYAEELPSQGGGIRPGRDNVYNLGTGASRWANVFAATFNGNVLGNLTGNSTGIHIGNVTAADSTVMINATTKLIGYDAAELRGTLFGNVQGNCAGTADNAVRLQNNLPSAILSSTSQPTIPIRTAEGNIVANQFQGTADKADRLRINNSAVDSDPLYRSAKTTKTPNSIAARDSSGNLFAEIFNGTATAAQYADLAEKYLADQEYVPGTVVAVGGEAEVTACTWGQRPIGIVSTNPAFMMNKDLEGGTYIALKGRVPCKVVGSVKKGDRLVASNQGCASAAIGHSSDIFAIALESNDDTSEKIIEVVVL